jgi:homocitrate synthase NifV
MPSIHFLDVTNRDGVQTARTGLSKFGKVMVNFYLGRLGVAQSEIGFPFLFHEVPYVRACLALAEAGAFGELRLSGWCRAVPPTWNQRCSWACGTTTCRSPPQTR